MQPRIRSDLTIQQVGEEALVLDLQSDQIHQLNGTAAWILGRCDGRTPVEVISGDFAAHFSISLETATKDVTAVVEQLQSIGVVETD